MQVSVGSQLLLLFVVGSYGWLSSVPSADDSEAVRRLIYYAPSSRRLETTHEYGRRPFNEDGSYEDISAAGRAPLSVADFYNEMDKRASGKQYTFGLGKRSRTYGFGLGKRLEDAWKSTASSFSPTYRQERRSKMYSFGLGKRGGGGEEFEFEDSDAGAATKKAKQFSFGLGKREGEGWSRAVETPS